MGVVVKVTRIARGVQCNVEYGLNVAIVAGNNFVTAEQLVLRVFVVVEDRLIPGDAAAVAGVTLITAMLIVGVVFEVARYAGLVHLVLEGIFGMAVAAGQVGVTAKQIKIGVAGMVKARIVPVTRVVAISALVSAAAVMRVILGVAIKTGCRRVRESAVFMAVETGGLEVFSEQRVVRCRVVEFGLQPFRWLVAIDAVAAHSVLVRFVILVAVHAFRGCVPVLVIRLVAVAALGVGMRSEEFKVREAMVEGGFIQDDYGRVTAQVLRMAGGTLVSLDFGAPPVESGFPVDVLGNIFMTIQAKQPLSTLVKLLVAGGATVLKVCVSCYDLSGHYEGLDILRRCVV